jgi:hypothetical protein
LILYDNELRSLLVVFVRSLEKDDRKQKRAAFENVRRYVLAHNTAQGVVDLVLNACKKNVDIRHLGVRIIEFASSEAHYAYREKLIDCADCGTLLYLVRVTLLPLTRREMVTLGHRIELLSPKVTMHDAFKLIITARDTPEMSELDCYRLGGQLGYSAQYGIKGC